MSSRNEDIIILPLAAISVKFFPIFGADDFYDFIVTYISSFVRSYYVKSCFRIREVVVKSIRVRYR